VCGIYNGFVVELYVNGVWEDDNELQGAVLQTTSFLKLGSCHGQQPAGECGRGVSFRGSLDNVKIYNRALSPAEIMTESSR